MTKTSGTVEVSTMTCPGCGRDTTVTKSGAWKRHNRPVAIPGGVASVVCKQSGQPAQERPVPAWIARAFGGDPR